MELIWMGFLLALGFYLMPLVMTVVMAVVVGIVSIITYPFTK